jgi:hypothetical protein
MMKPEWRTSTVVGICERIRETEDYSACPILADALQDAGCDDEGLLAELRDCSSLIQEERLVSLVYSEKTAEAVQRIDGFVVELGEGGYPGNLPAMTYETLMDAARKYVKDPNSNPLGAGSMNWSNATAEPEVEIQFWKDFELVSGIKTEFQNQEWGTEMFNCHC